MPFIRWVWRFSEWVYRSRARSNNFLAELGLTPRTLSPSLIFQNLIGMRVGWQSSALTLIHIKYFLILLSEYNLHNTIWYSFTFVIWVREIDMVRAVLRPRGQSEDGRHNRPHHHLEFPCGWEEWTQKDLFMWEKSVKYIYLTPTYKTDTTEAALGYQQWGEGTLTCSCPTSPLLSPSALGDRDPTCPCPTFPPLSPISPWVISMRTGDPHLFMSHLSSPLPHQSLGDQQWEQETLTCSCPTSPPLSLISPLTLEWGKTQ